MANWIKRAKTYRKSKKSVGTTDTTTAAPNPANADIESEQNKYVQQQIVNTANEAALANEHRGVEQVPIDDTPVDNTEPVTPVNDKVGTPQSVPNVPGGNPYMQTAEMPQVPNAPINLKGRVEPTATTATAVPNAATAPVQEQATTETAGEATQTTPTATSKPSPYIAGNDDLRKAQDEYQQTMQEPQSIYRELMNKYKPESPEEKAKREKRERMRRNFIGLANMGAAIGNLVTASSKDGRAVETPKLTEAADHAIEKQRALRDANDKKYLDAAREYYALRQGAAKQKYENAYNAYINAQKEAQAREANALARYKIDAEERNREADRNMKILFKQADVDAKDKDRAVKWAEVRLKQKKQDEAASDKNNKGGNKESSGVGVPIPINGGRQVLTIRQSMLKEPILLGVLENMLPDDYKIKVGVNELGEQVISGGKVVQDFVSKGYKDDALVQKVLGVYFNDSHKNDGGNWKEVQNLLTAAGEITDNKDFTLGMPAYGTTVGKTRSPYKDANGDSGWQQHLYGAK